MRRSRTIPQRNPDRVPAGLALSDAAPAAPPPMQHDFRSIQGVSDLTSGLPASYVDIVALRIANKSEVKERISDDWRFCASAIGKKERSIGNRSRRRDCREFGPSTSLHPVWVEHSARDCRGPVGARGFPWRRRHLCSGCPPALLYRMLSSSGLLRGEPQAAFFDGAPTGVRVVLWRRGARSNESCRFAALRASLQGPLQTS